MKLSTLITRLSSLATAAFAAATASADPTVGQVLVHQLWPWSQNVKVEYTLSGTDGGAYDVDVSCYEAGVEIAASKVRSALCGGEGFHGVKGDGIHTFTLDPSQLVAEDATALGNFTVSITVAGPGDPLASRLEYRVFDLETGEVTDLTRGDIYDHPDLYGSTVYTNYADVYSGFTKPSDLPAEDVFIVPGFNTDEFKTTKLVMKRIPAAEKEFWMGPSDGDPNTLAAGSWSEPRLGESRFKAVLSQDYFMSVFELTQRQYELVVGDNPSFFTNRQYYATRPLEFTSRDTFTAAESGFLAKATAMFGKTFNLPTEAQWEFAAKAMYDGPGYPSGLEITQANLGVMEGVTAKRGHSGYPDAGRNDATNVGGTWDVGRGQPNPYGLYNMFGNVSERMLDASHKDLATKYGWTDGSPAVRDPYNTQYQLASGQVVYKGGNYASNVDGNQRRSAWRGSSSKTARVLSITHPLWGFRVICPVD